MKSLITAIFFLCLPFTALIAQPSPTEEVSGVVTLPDNTQQPGSIKDNIRKKGEIVCTADGKKTRYKAADITAVKIGNIQYISRNNTFYEVIWQGENTCLLRKASEASGMQYNGSEAVIISSEGKIDDYFVKKNNTGAFELITKKNAKEVLKTLCASCTAEIATFDVDNLKKALQACDTCK